MKIVYVDSAHLDLSYLLLPLEVCCFAGCVPVALDHHGEARVSRNGLSVEASLGQHDVTAKKGCFVTVAHKGDHFIAHSPVHGPAEVAACTLDQVP